MSFQIHALPMETFAPLFSLDDEKLATRRARRVTATTFPGFPCRVSLQDAAVGEQLVLVNYTHLDSASPYRASHAVFVREHARQAQPEVGEVPDVLKRRPLSLRAYDSDWQMVAAELASGDDVADALKELLKIEAVGQIHLHNAKPGCYAARAVRATH